MKIKATLYRLDSEVNQKHRPSLRTANLIPVMKEAIINACEGQTTTLAEVRESICAYYAQQGVRISPEAILLGTHGEDCLRLAARENVAAVVVPGDLQMLARHAGDGRTGNTQDGFYRGLEYITAFDEIDFKAPLPTHEPTILHLPAVNPATGVAWTEREELRWVRYAENTGMTILYDASWRVYSTQMTSLYRLPEANAHILEWYDLSAIGLAGLSYTIVPDGWQADCGTSTAKTADRVARDYLTNTSWSPILAAALQAWFTPLGQEQWQAYCEKVMARTRRLRAYLMMENTAVWGGDEAPILWTQATPQRKEKLLRCGADVQDGEVYSPDGVGYLSIYLNDNTQPEIYR